MYEVTFAKLSERFFKGTTWPPVEDIAELVDKDSVFCLLYKVCAARPAGPHGASLQPMGAQACWRFPRKAWHHPLQGQACMHAHLVGLG